MENENIEVEKAAKMWWNDKNNKSNLNEYLCTNHRHLQYTTFEQVCRTHCFMCIFKAGFDCAIRELKSKEVVK